MKNTKNLKWYLNRLSCMSFGEVIYRFRNKLASGLEGKRLRGEQVFPRLIADSHAKDWCYITSDIKSDDYCHRANQILLGRFDIFALRNENIGSPPKWNKDARTGTISPLIFGKTLNYRDESIVGDIKYLWEPSRHLQLVTLCQAYALGKDEKYIIAFQEQLDSWFEQCPYMLGPHWVSSLELGIRLINWSICWQLIGGGDSDWFKNPAGEIFKKKWLTSIYQHCEFISGYWSKYSSANNHLIGEAAGLFIGAMTWPYWKNSAQWKNVAYRILLEQSAYQTFDDGVNKEQAISYQQFVADFLLLAALCGRANDVEFPEQYWNLLENMLEYIVALMDFNGNIPMIGDADDGYVIELSCEANFCNYKSLLATGAVLFSRGDFKKKSRFFDDKSKFLLGDEGVEKYEELGFASVAMQAKQCFPQAGYYILGDNLETPDEVKMLVDSGPLGFLSLAAHGHADALSIYLSVGGHEFLIDPGTYAYHTQQKWRDYFRGTSAHNTIRIDKVDQSVSGGNFMWIKHAHACCDEFLIKEDQVLFNGSHDGYTRLDDPVTHQRKIVLDKRNKIFEIEDTLRCDAEHVAEIFWHFGENCTIELSGNGEIVAYNNGKMIKLFPEYIPKATRFYGDDDFPAGWVSRKFDLKTPTTTVVWEKKIKGTTVLHTKVLYN